MPRCPSCKSKSLFYVQRTYEYWKVNSIKDGTVSLGEIESSIVDDEYPHELWCEGCEKSFDLKLKQKS